MPQYKSTQEEVVTSVIPMKQLAAQITTRQQVKRKSPEPSDAQMEKELKTDTWFSAYPGELTEREETTWKGDKLYVPASLQIQVLQCSPDAKQAGHFRFLKMLHLTEWQFWWT